MAAAWSPCTIRYARYGVDRMRASVITFGTFTTWCSAWYPAHHVM
jgi:hypothetical protein